MHQTVLRDNIITCLNQKINFLCQSREKIFKLEFGKIEIVTFLIAISETKILKSFFAKFCRTNCFPLIKYIFALFFYIMLSQTFLNLRFCLKILSPLLPNAKLTKPTMCHTLIFKLKFA